MSPARRFALALSKASFRFILVLVITLAAAYATFNSSSEIETVLDKNQAYSRIVPAVLEMNAKQDQSSIFNDPQIRLIFQSAFTPDYLKKETKGILNVAYGWLNGQTLEPTYSIDISMQRGLLAEELSIYGIERLSTLPTCTALDDIASIDPFTAKCQPIGVNYKTEQLALQQSLQSSNEFLPKVIYTQADLPKSQNGKTLPQSLSMAPVAFQAVRPLLIFLLLTLVILSYSMVALRPVKRNGWRDLGKSLFFGGIFLAASAYIFGIFVPQISRQFQSQFIGNGAEKLFTDISRDLFTSFETVFITASLIAAGIGALIVLAVKLVRPGSRYKSLEHITGLTNAVSPRRSVSSKGDAQSAPVVSSESRKKRSKPSQKKSRAKKEIA